MFENDITDAFNDRVRILAFGEQFAEERVGIGDVFNVPENLLYELGSAFRWDDVFGEEGFYPVLKMGIVRNLECDRRLKRRTFRRYSRSRAKSRSVRISSLIAS